MDLGETIPKEHYLIKKCAAAFNVKSMQADKCEKILDNEDKK